MFWSSNVDLQYLILREFLEKKIASFITLSVSLYSKQMLHRKVILKWPWASITKNLMQSFFFFIFHFHLTVASSFFFDSLSFLGVLVSVWMHIHGCWLNSVAWCSVLWVWFPLPSWKGWLTQTPVSFFEYVNACLMAANNRHTLDGWMSFSCRPSWPISALSQALSPSAFPHPPPPSYPSLKCEVWSSRLCAMIAVIGLKMESSLSLCHWTNKLFVFNECFFFFFFFLVRLFKNTIT